jgi:hypothetical protein
VLRAEEEDEYPENSWASQQGGPRRNNLGLAKQRVRKEEEADVSESTTEGGQTTHGASARGTTR